MRIPRQIAGIPLWVGAFVLTIFGLRPISQAELVIEWGGNYVSGTQHMILPTPVDDGMTRRWPYSFTKSINPTYEYRHTFNDTTVGPEFFGVIEHTDRVDGPANLVRNRMTDKDPNDVLEIWGSAYVSARNDLGGMIFFKVPEMPASNVLMKSGDSFSFTLSTTGSAGNNFRIAVYHEGQWYLHMTKIEGAGAKDLTIGELDEALWGGVGSGGR